MISRHYRMRVFASVVFVILPACTWWRKEKKTGLVLINVLDEKLYNDCHIEGSIHVPFEKLGAYAQKNVSKDAEIVVYCSNYMCSSSEMGCKQLKELGFDNVWVYEGGTAEWYQKGLPVVGPAKEGYLKMKMDKPPYESVDLAVISFSELERKLQMRSSQSVES